MDRANNRVIHLGLDGKFIGVVEEGLLLPACVHIHGDWAVVGELRGRVTISIKKGISMPKLEETVKKMK
jgi:non-canonical (house-cleaning) NTP pyrophosphatase